MTQDKAGVEQMFDSIAHKYDFLNHFLSLGIDKRWRSLVIRKVKVQGARRVLDVATGTGDLAIALKKRVGCDVVGCDFSQGMLDVGRRKVEGMGIELERQDVHSLTYGDGSFDAVTCAFGVRNFRDLEVGLGQMYRVLEKSGKCYILEFSQVAKGSLWGAIYRFYFGRILPMIGRWISGDGGAYSYLPSSVEGFACGGELVEVMEGVGFVNCGFKPLMGGVATIYWGQKL